MPVNVRGGYVSQTGLHARLPFIPENDVAVNQFRSTKLELSSITPLLDKSDSAVAYEPVARKIYSSSIFETQKNEDLDREALFEKLSYLPAAHKLSECIDGNQPFASINFGARNKFHVAVLNDKDNGLLKLDFYTPSDERNKSESVILSTIDQFRLKQCIKLIAEHFYSYYNLKERGFAYPRDIIKFSHIEE